MISCASECVHCHQSNNLKPNETTRNWTTHPSTKGFFFFFHSYIWFILSFSTFDSQPHSVSVCLNEMRFLVAKPFGKYATSRANRQTNSSVFFFSRRLVILLNVWAWFGLWDSLALNKKSRINCSTNSKLMDSDQDRICINDRMCMQNGIWDCFLCPYIYICLSFSIFAGIFPAFVLDLSFIRNAVLYFCLSILKLCKLFHETELFCQRLCEKLTALQSHSMWFNNFECCKCRQIDVWCNY